MGYSEHESYIKKLGLRIKYLRNERNMTQVDLSITSDMEENAVQRIETGRTNPTTITLLKIAKGLGVDVKDLFEFSSMQ